MLQTRGLSLVQINCTYPGILFFSNKWRFPNAWRNFLLGLAVTELYAQLHSSPKVRQLWLFTPLKRKREEMEGKGAGSNKAGKKGVGKSHDNFSSQHWRPQLICLSPNWGHLAFSKLGSWVMLAPKCQALLETCMRMFSYLGYSSTHASDHHTFVFKRILLTFFFKSQYILSKQKKHREEYYICPHQVHVVIFVKSFYKN